MLSLKIQHSSGWRMSSRREEAILRQTSCVCVCAWWHSCRQNLEYSIITLAHPGTSRKASHKCLCANTHVCTHTPPPHISGTAGPLLRSSNTPAEGGGSCGGGLVVEEEGRAVGYGGAWGWWGDIETKVKHKPSVLFCYRPISGWQQRRVTKSRFRVRFWETCDGGAARGSDGILDLTFAALPCIVFQLCLSLAI